MRIVRSGGGLRRVLVTWSLTLSMASATAKVLAPAELATSVAKKLECRSQEAGMPET
jgi:hypothetical protein